MTRINAQETLKWSEADRKYLHENLIRTRELALNETKNLSREQWNFKETPNRWSINQIIEHLAIWELLFQREISSARAAGPHPEMNNSAKPDSMILGFIMDEHPHVTTDFTKPFSFSVPMGINTGENNLKWLLKLRNESINYVDSTRENLREYYLKAGRPNIHQVFINSFGHVDRHLRQIKKLKQNKNYPKI
ncbi:MAG: hypothetical protein NVS1B13_25660 [Flavisolibacter sp.]